jgi:sporulation protein YlmC with PRC-barrel domain
MTARERQKKEILEMEMKMGMEIPMGEEVRCAGKACGRSLALVINPVTDTVTHLVVKETHFPNMERLVSVDEVTKTTPDSIELKCTKDQLEVMDLFSEKQFVHVDTPHYSPVGMTIFASPYVIADTAATWITVEEEHVPPNELAVRRSAEVEATDGHIGKVDEFLVDPETCHISHLVMREGHLWGKKDIVIPVKSIDHFEEDTVYLKLSKKEVEKLPIVPIRRGILS